VRSATLVIIFMCATGFLVFGACKSTKKTAQTVPTSTKSAPSTAAPTSATASTSVPVRTTASSAGLAKLTGVQVASAGDHDHVVFTFGTSVATPHVDSPVTSPTYCASGAPVQVTGQYFLEVRFASATAHNDDGTPSVAQTSIQANLPAVLEAVQTCDFEGTVTWLLEIRTVTPVQRSKEAGTSHTVDVTHS
jgi:hypothetical protein